MKTLELLQTTLVVGLILFCVGYIGYYAWSQRYADCDEFKNHNIGSVPVRCFRELTNSPVN